MPIPKTVRIKIIGRCNYNGEDGTELEVGETYDVSPSFARELCERGGAAVFSEKDAAVIESLGRMPDGVTIIEHGDPVVANRDPVVEGSGKRGR